jgi:hypothetical protein
MEPDFSLILLTRSLFSFLGLQYDKMIYGYNPNKPDYYCIVKYDNYYTGSGISANANKAYIFALISMLSHKYGSN